MDDIFWLAMLFPLVWPFIAKKFFHAEFTIIESGRNDFRLAQTKLIDQKRGYETQLGSFWRGSWLGVAGYPKVNLEDFKIITTAATQDTFNKGVEAGPLKIR